jgi:hypothetical protein
MAARFRNTGFFTVASCLLHGALGALAQEVRRAASLKPEWVMKISDGKW